MIVCNREAFVCLEALLFLQGSNPTSSRDLFFSISLSPTSQIEEKVFLGTNTEPSVLESQWRHSSLVTGELQKNNNSSVNVLKANFVSTLHWSLGLFLPQILNHRSAYSILASSPGPTQTWSHLQTSRMCWVSYYVTITCLTRSCGSQLLFMVALQSRWTDLTMEQLQATPVRQG